ncbi:hypothetical protein AB0N24_05970 [Arthrobacter sp. NPDC093128]|uniref:hypothetical protein n=1 Tax=Arthrobacter sp. NPDC093128 TaxID=3154979 RepID=UPI00343D9739
MSNALKLVAPENPPFVDSEREFDYPAAGYPDVVTLEFGTFEDLPGGRSKLTSRSVYPSVEACARFLADGMEAGIAAGYEQLDELLGR